MLNVIIIPELTHLKIPGTEWRVELILTQLFISLIICIAHHPPFRASQFTTRNTVMQPLFLIYDHVDREWSYYDDAP